MTEAGYDMDKLALASMIADHLRGVPIRPEELPDGAWDLVAAYVAMLDYGTQREGPTGLKFMGQRVRLRVRPRGRNGRDLPVLPVIQRGAGRVIDADESGPLGEHKSLG